MKLEDVQKEWEKDSIIDQANLGFEATRNPLLHSKYLNRLSNVKLLARKAEVDYLKLRKDKYRYFKGEMTKHELEERGWAQYQGRVPLKTEMEEYLTTDHDMIRLTDKIEYLKVVKETLESILKALASRGWEIKSAIEWEKMRNGLM
jgi:hypothetical protein